MADADSVRSFFSTRLPIVLYCLVGVGLLFQGVRYLSATEIMPYHLAVVAADWQNLGQEYQTLLLGLLKGFGAGSLGVGLAIILLALVPLRRGESWARWAIPLVAATYTAALVYVTRFALLPGAVPITVTATLLGLVILAGVCALFSNSADDP